MKVKGGSEMRMEGDEIKLFVLVYGYSVISMQSLDRKGDGRL